MITNRANGTILRLLPTRGKGGNEGVAGGPHPPSRNVYRYKHVRESLRRRVSEPGLSPEATIGTVFFRAEGTALSPVGPELLLAPLPAGTSCPTLNHRPLSGRATGRRFSSRVSREPAPAIE